MTEQWLQGKGDHWAINPPHLVIAEYNFNVKGSTTGFSYLTGVK
jgi:hypothetical protein